MSNVIVSERTENRKLGDLSCTWVPQQSCHEDCPLKKNGCYAEMHRAGLHTHRLNGKARDLKMGLGKLRLKLALQEAAGIRSLSGKRKLRVHVVGDCATPETATIVGKAMVDYENKRHRKAAWTYTHSWRHVPLEAWAGARVLASCEKPEDVAKALAKGYAVALVTPFHPSNKVYQYGGLNVLPCPAQFKSEEGKRTVTCEDCNICQNPQMLRDRNLVVGFQPDGNTHLRVLRVING
jgi:hypothetical protein